VQRDGVLALAALTQRIIAADPPSYERALARYVDHDQRFATDPAVRAELEQSLAGLHAALSDEAAAAGPLLDARPPELEALAAAIGRLHASSPRSEEDFHAVGLLPELVALLAQKLGVFRRVYLDYVATLPPTGAYAPRYLNFGPSGLCNLRCEDCILWGALFTGPRHRPLASQGLHELLDDAERSGVHSLSFCIGEPTLDLALLEAALLRVRASATLQARSFVTNGLFGRDPARARSVWSRVLAALGEEKSRSCAFAISANPELVRQGVLPAHTIEALAAFCEVMPNELALLQLIRDEDTLETQRTLVELLVQRGLLRPEHCPADLGAGLVRELPLVGGKRLVFLVMAKMPAINSPGGELASDPYVFYINPAALQRRPFPGLFMPMNAQAGDLDEGERSERISLGPDGQLYADYHFMVRQVRPLGRTLPEAIEAFRRDPLLSALAQPGGLNDLLAAYHAMPLEQRPIHDLTELLGRYSTVSMAAANLLFGDEDMALRLARWWVEGPRG